MRSMTMRQMTCPPVRRRHPVAIRLLPRQDLCCLPSLTTSALPQGGKGKATLANDACQWGLGMRQWRR
jgi:hypothetical protein